MPKEKNITFEQPVVKETNFLDKLILTILKIEIFFIPLFFWPWTFEIFEFNKQNLLWFLTFLALVFWVINFVIIKKKIIYRRTPLDLPILIFLILWGLSVIFSIDWYSSLFGFYGRFSDAYLSVLALALFYFLIVNVTSKEQIVKFFNVFLASSFVILITALFSLSGLINKLLGELGRFNIIKANSFNLLGGSSEALALFAAVMLVFVTALYSYNIKGTKKLIFLKFKYYLLFFLSLAVLLLTNFALAWISLLFGLVALFVFALYITYVNRENKESLIDISISPALVFFLLSIFFLFLFGGEGGWNLQKKLFQGTLPREVVLDNQNLRTITWQSFKNNPFLGSGPATFAYNFSQFRPTSFNNLRFWQLRFDKAPVHLMELLTTVGLIGLLSYLSVIGVLFFVIFVFLKNISRVEPEDCYLAFGFSFAVLTLFMSQAVYLMNTSLYFIFWLFLSLAIINWRLAYANVFSDKEIDLENYKDLNPVFNTLIIALCICFVFFSYWQIRYYLADLQYNNYRLNSQQKSLESAVKLNTRRLNYHIALSKDYLNEVRDEINILSSPRGEVDLDNQAREKLQINIEKALQEAKLATGVAPNSVMAWENLGVIYRDVRLIAVGANEWAIDSFQKASNLEPSNPVLLTELGKSYLAAQQTSEAVNALQKAIAQKANYYDAYVNLAKVYESLGQIDKALVSLEEVIIKKPVPEIIYESGRLYYNQDQVDKAIERFKQAIELQPNYANAIYSLGLAEQKKGDKVRALEQFERVLELNPENEAVRKLIAELEEEE